MKQAFESAPRVPPEAGNSARATGPYPSGRAAKTAHPVPTRHVANPTGVPYPERTPSHLNFHTPTGLPDPLRDGCGHPSKVREPMFRPNQPFQPTVLTTKRTQMIKTATSLFTVCYNKTSVTPFNKTNPNVSGLRLPVALSLTQSGLIQLLFLGLRPGDGTLWRERTAALFGVPALLKADRKTGA